MTKVSSLVCTASAMLLIFGTAMADDSTQNEQAKPAVTTPDNQSKPKEVTADTPPSQDNAVKPQEVPAQGAPAQAEPDCNN